MNKDEYISTFDQEAAIMISARLAMHLSKEMEPREIMKYLDKKLIQLYHRFGSYHTGNISSFTIAENINLIPQFFYFLRKSTFILIFGVAIDEHEYRKAIFLRENCTNCLTMIQPSLTEYNMEKFIVVTCNIL